MLTVKELLCLPQMNEAKLIAGKHGCNRIIKWTHVIDHEEVGYFLEGGELLFTCGQIWPQQSLPLLQSFIANRASGIVFAVGRYLEKVPEEVITFANSYNLPIIEIPFHIYFVKLIKSIHEVIIQEQFIRAQKLHHISKTFLQTMSSTNDIGQLVRYAAEELNNPLLFTSNTNLLVASHFPKQHALYASAMKTQLLQRIDGIEHPFQHFARGKNMLDFSYFSIQIGNLPPVHGLSLQSDAYYFGTLWMYDTTQKGIHAYLSALESIVEVLIDLSITKLEQQLIYQQECTQFFQMIITQHELLPLITPKKIEALGIPCNSKWICMIIQDTYSDQQKTILSMRQKALHWLTEAPHIHGLIDIFNQQLVFLLTYSDDPILYKEIKLLQHHLSSKQLISLFLGTSVDSIIDIITSYEQAKTLVSFIPTEHTATQIYFAKDYLKEILLFGTFDYERAQALRGSILPPALLQDEVLLETLNILVKNEYNRDYTAKQLFIHRNTLRYRLLKIEKILNDSLSSLICQFWLKIAFEIEHVTKLRRNCATSTKTASVELNS